MKNIVVNYTEILNLLRSELEITKGGNPDFSNITLIVEDEQSWIKDNTRNPNAIYIVVHFTDAAINFGQAVVPVTLEVLSIQNEIELTQAFLNEFVSNYNRTQINDITQLYLTPSVSLNFNEVYEGFRSLLTLQSTFIIGNNTVRLETLTYYYGDNQSEEIEILSYNDTSENSLNPQPYFNTKGRTKSYGSFQTFAFSIVTYPDGSKQLIKDIMAMKFDVTRSHQNDTFKFSGTFANSDVNMPLWEFKCKEANFEQKIGEIPVCTLGFSL